MALQRPGRRALVVALTVVAALLPISLVVAISAFADGPTQAGGNSGSGPAVVGFSPQEGTIRGGTAVQISGGGFQGVTGVSFGGRPAQTFQALSETAIRAVTPAVPRGVNVRIAVTTASGTATSNRDFTFIGCHVPRLIGDRLGRARKALLVAGCKVGRVTRAAGAREPLRVIAAGPGPGRWLEPGANVNLRLR